MTLDDILDLHAAGTITRAEAKEWIERERVIAVTKAQIATIETIRAGIAVLPPT